MIDGVWTTTPSRIQKILQQHVNVVFTKSYCGYCRNMVLLLRKHKIPFHDVVVDEQDSKFEIELKRHTKMQTYPQVYLHRQLIGGTEETKLYLNDRLPESELSRKFYQLKYEFSQINTKKNNELDDLQITTKKLDELEKVTLGLYHEVFKIVERCDDMQKPKKQQINCSKMVRMCQSLMDEINQFRIDNNLKKVLVA